MSPRTGDNDIEKHRPRTDWSRVADGVGLAGVGVFLLVATVRGLPDGFWIDAISFWPVLLVSAGIRIVFEKTPLAPGMVLGPTVVLAALFWLAWGERPEMHPPGEWHALSAARPEGIERARVRADLAGVHVGLESRPLAPGLLAEGRAASRERTPRLEVDTGEEGDVTVRLRGRRSGFLMIGMRREVWELGVTDALPLEVETSGAFLRGEYDLRRAWLAYAQTSGAFNAATFLLPPPSGSVKIRLRGAFSIFDVKVPEGTPVRYHGPGFPVVWGERDMAREGVGDEPGYTVILEGAFSAVNIEEAPPPAGGWPPPRPRLPTPEDEADTPEDSASPEASPHPPAEAAPADTGPAPPAEDPEGA